jgi:hypothetical protein
MLGGAVEYGPQVVHISRAPAPHKAAVASNAVAEAPEAVTGDGSPVPVPNMTIAAPISPSTATSSPRP